MRFTEIANPEDQLALWRLISDNVWSAVAAQARELARQKAQAAATSPKVKKPKPKKAVPKPIQPPKPKAPAPRAKSPAHKPHPAVRPMNQQVRAVTPSPPPPLPSAQPVLRPTHSSSFSQADLHGLKQGLQYPPQSFTPQNPF